MSYSRWQYNPTPQQLRSGCNLCCCCCYSWLAVSVSSCGPRWTAPRAGRSTCSLPSSRSVFTARACGPRSSPWDFCSSPAAACVLFSSCSHSSSSSAGGKSQCQGCPSALLCPGWGSVSPPGLPLGLAMLKSKILSTREKIDFVTHCDGGGPLPWCS